MSIPSTAFFHPFRSFRSIPSRNSPPLPPLWRVSRFHVFVPSTVLTPRSFSRDTRRKLHPATPDSRSVALYGGGSIVPGEDSVALHFARIFFFLVIVPFLFNRRSDSPLKIIIHSFVETEAREFSSPPVIYLGNSFAISFVSFLLE